MPRLVRLLPPSITCARSPPRQWPLPQPPRPQPLEVVAPLLVAAVGLQPGHLPERARPVLAVGVVAAPQARPRVSRGCGRRVFTIGAHG